VLERDSAALGNRRAALGLLRSGLDPGDVAHAVRRTGARIVHAHNLHPSFGARALKAARDAGARTVLHLHNYRLVCAIAVAYRDGAPCFLCHGRDTRPGLRHRCRGSLAESAVYAAGLARQQPRLLRHADALVAVSEALASRLAGMGVPRERMTVVPNAVRAIAGASRAGEGRYALVAGRLVEEKGVDVAVRAAREAGVPLHVAGVGPEEERLRALAEGADVTFLGQLARGELAAQRRGAAVLLAPSRSDDPCPMAVVEALADGVPVLGSDRGGIPELVGADATLEADDAAAWAGALRALWSDAGARAAAGEAALARARARHAPDAWYAGLMGVYAS
ncbi:MAG TPA: glycosyltransferase, partial [Conexibacter sp.]|nr:glycosyltransferase [Conexibacter sp.]